MWIVIPTIKGYEHAVDFLKMSMGPQTAVIMVYQGEESDGYTKTDEGYKVTLKRNIFEYGAWVGVKMLADAGEISLEDNWFLMIHDTCKFTEDTVVRLLFTEMILRCTPIELYFLVSGRFHSICLARKNGISILADYFKDVHSMTKEEACKLECNLPVEGIVTGDHCLRPFNASAKEDVYGDGKLRNVSVLESIKLVKFYA